LGNKLKVVPEDEKKLSRLKSSLVDLLIVCKSTNQRTLGTSKIYCPMSYTSQRILHNFNFEN